MHVYISKNLKKRKVSQDLLKFPQPVSSKNGENLFLSGTKKIKKTYFDFFPINSFSHGPFFMVDKQLILASWSPVAMWRWSTIWMIEHKPLYNSFSHGPFLMVDKQLIWASWSPVANTMLISTHYGWLRINNICSFQAFFRCLINS